MNSFLVDINYAMGPKNLFSIARFPYLFGTVKFVLYILTKWVPINWGSTDRFNYIYNVSLSRIIVIDCGQLRDIANGRVDLTGTTVGSRATYSCASGYKLVGDATRTCQGSGAWSGREPFCKSELIRSPR